MVRFQAKLRGQQGLAPVFFTSGHAIFVGEQAAFVKRASGPASTRFTRKWNGRNALHLVST